MRSGTQLLRKGGAAVAGSTKGSDRILMLVFMVDQSGRVGPLPRTLTVHGLLGAAYARQVECWMNGQQGTREREI